MTVEVRQAPYAGWRALAATVLVLSGAAGAHTWAGGHVPDGSVLVALGALVLGGSILVLRGAVRATVLLPVLALAQAGLHASFSTSLTTDAVGHAGHLGHLSHGAASSPWTGRMLLAHAAVTLLTALVWHLCARAGSVVLSVVRFVDPLAGPPRRRTPLTAGRVVRPGRTLLLLAPRRGPPVPRPA